MRVPRAWILVGLAACSADASDPLSAGDAGPSDLPIFVDAAQDADANTGSPDTGSVDSGLEVLDTGVGDAGAAGVSLQPSSVQISMDLQPAVEPDPIGVRFRLSFNNPDGDTTPVRISDASLRFGDDVRHTFSVTPESHVPPAGTSEQLYEKVKGSGSDVFNPEQYCGTEATLTLTVSTGDLLSGAGTALCVH